MHNKMKPTGASSPVRTIKRVLMILHNCSTHYSIDMQNVTVTYHKASTIMCTFSPNHHNTQVFIFTYVRLSACADNTVLGALVVIFAMLWRRTNCRIIISHRHCTFTCHSWLHCVTGSCCSLSGQTYQERCGWSVDQCQVKASEFLRVMSCTF